MVTSQPYQHEGARGHPRWVRWWSLGSIAAGLVAAGAGCPSGPSRGDHLRRCTALAGHFRQILGREGHHAAVTQCAQAAESPELRRAWAALAGCALKASAGAGLTRCLDRYPIRGAFEQWERLVRARDLVAQGRWDEAWQSCFARYEDMRPLREREPHRAKLGEKRYRWCAEHAETILAHLPSTPHTLACREILGRDPGVGPRSVLYAVGERRRLGALRAACRKIR